MQAIVSTLLPDVADRVRIFAGDVVPRKKPDPAIYLLAAQELGLDPARCLVIEDSDIGLRAAKVRQRQRQRGERCREEITVDVWMYMSQSAGMKCVVTMSAYTRGEDFQGADVVLPEINFSLEDVVMGDSSQIIVRT